MVSTGGEASHLLNVSSDQGPMPRGTRFQRRLCRCVASCSSKEPCIPIRYVGFPFMHVVCAPKLAALWSVLRLAVDLGACGRASTYAKGSGAFDACSCGPNVLFSVVSFLGVCKKGVSVCLLRLGRYSRVYRIGQFCF